jgi:hypothetical protein
MNDLNQKLARSRWFLLHEPPSAAQDDLAARGAPVTFPANGRPMQDGPHIMKMNDPWGSHFQKRHSRTPAQVSAIVSKFPRKQFGRVVTCVSHDIDNSDVDRDSCAGGLMRYVNWLRRVISDAAEWLRDDAGHCHDGNQALSGGQPDDPDDPFYVAFFGPHA